VKVKLVLNGKEHVADVAEMLNKVTIGEVRTIKQETGMTPAMLHTKLEELKRADPDDPRRSVPVGTRRVFGCGTLAAGMVASPLT
jgi:hypothetical protein